MANLRTVVIAPGSSSGQFFPTAADGNIYKLVEFIIDAHVVKTYYFIAAHAVAVDAWLFTDTDQIIGEVHRITSQHPVDNALKYWFTQHPSGLTSSRLQSLGSGLDLMTKMGIQWDLSLVPVKFIPHMRMAHVKATLAKTV